MEDLNKQREKKGSNVTSSQELCFCLTGSFLFENSSFENSSQRFDSRENLEGLKTSKESHASVADAAALCDSKMSRSEDHACDQPEFLWAQWTSVKTGSNSFISLD
jgi:hypothetical protein